ncbi:hypothetical protein QVD17_12063 [Tagetes erecta]|uniref:Uncharacterized protein n=1 Tax=Tagetes erecta TaxID=13708 RepID=A0AAD8P2K0_TARER|nr:hypothetical protein QVD17_12063 [Tagetes erecta]
MERLMIAKEEELNSTIHELQTLYFVSQEKLTKEEAEKLAAIESLTTEKNALMTVERSLASLIEYLEKALKENSSLNQKVISLNDMYKRLQEYNGRLQQYKSKLQIERNQTSETLNKFEREKAAVTTRKFQSNTLKDALASEVGCLRRDLHQVREGHDRELSLVQDLTAELVQYTECTGKSAAELFTLKSRSVELEFNRHPFISFM